MPRDLDEFRSRRLTLCSHFSAFLAGQRETVFNRLGELSIGDEIAIETAAGTFRYKVRQFRIVDRDDRTVIVPTETAVLTLATCYPINFVGITHQSFIVVADLVGATYEQ